MKNQLLNLDAVVSIGVCSALVFIGLVRLLSYSQGATGDFVRHSPLGFLCYNPDSLLNARFFKILATPSVIAMVYFFFRWRNARGLFYPGSAKFDDFHRLDFRSPLLRGILTSVVTIHWVGMEWWKFHVEGYYPWSPLESRSVNIWVLLTSQALAFWGMKYLSFKPIFKDRPIPDL
jgi:hypothetical protein